MPHPVLELAVSGVPLAEIAAAHRIDPLTARTRLRVELDRAGYSRYTLAAGLELARIAALRRKILAAQRSNAAADMTVRHLDRLERRIMRGPA